jgi:hypothetical protein
MLFAYPIKPHQGYYFLGGGGGGGAFGVGLVVGGTFVLTESSEGAYAGVGTMRSLSA